MPDKEKTEPRAKKPRRPKLVPTEHEPPPKQDDSAPAAWDVAIDRAQKLELGNENLIRSMQARDEYGLRKYGTRLSPGNGRDDLNDLTQEVLDAVCYSACAVMNGHGWASEILDLQLRCAAKLVKQRELEVG